MAKLVGPLFSKTAHGSIGNMLEYSRRGILNLLRKKQRPTDGQTPDQVAQRDLFLQSINDWDTLSPSEKLQWHVFNKG